MAFTLRRGITVVPLEAQYSALRAVEDDFEVSTRTFVFVLLLTVDVLSLKLHPRPAADRATYRERLQQVSSLVYLSMIHF